MDWEMGDWGLGPIQPNPNPQSQSQRKNKKTQSNHQSNPIQKIIKYSKNLTLNLNLLFFFLLDRIWKKLKLLLMNKKNFLNKC